MAIFENKKDKSRGAGSGSAGNEAAAPSVKVTAGFRNVLVSPRLSEKAAQLQRNGKYVFNVTPKANKVEVKKAIEQSYKVTVTQVNMIKMDGKNRTFGRTAGKTSNFKKAIVTLKKGDSIEAGDANI